MKRDDEIFKKCLNLILGDYKRFSDIDIAIENGNKKAIATIRYQIENLNIPYKLEIIDLSKVSKKFKKEILETGVLIWRN